MRDTGNATGKMEALARSSFTIRFLSGPLHQRADTPTVLSLSAGATLLGDNQRKETKETKGRDERRSEHPIELPRAKDIR